MKSSRFALFPALLCLALCPAAIAQQAGLAPKSALAQQTITAQLTDGSVVNGEVVSWDDENLSIKSSFGTLVLGKDKLSAKTLNDLKRFKYDPSSATREELVAKVQELEAAVASLRKDNAALRDHVPADTGAGKKANPAKADSNKTGGKYWISKSGKRHNENCQYFGSGKGEEGTADQGTPCGRCGG